MSPARRHFLYTGYISFGKNKEVYMTAQVPEKLIFNGEETSMTFCPPIPDDPQIIKELSLEEFNSDLEAKKCDDIVFSTACWRQYIGTWEIKDDKFYLNKLEGAIRLVKDEPVHATWFTGVLRVPQGKMLHYVHMGFGSIYEGEIHIKIENGVVVDQRTIDNSEKAQKAENQSIEEQFLEGFRNMPGNENHFDGDDF